MGVHSFIDGSIWFNIEDSHGLIVGMLWYPFLGTDDWSIWRSLSPPRRVRPSPGWALKRGSVEASQNFTSGNNDER